LDQITLHFAYCITGAWMVSLIERNGINQWEG
jgi:hypothetical protein